MSDDAINQARAQALADSVKVKITQNDDIRGWTEAELAAAAHVDALWARDHAVPELRRRQSEARAERLEVEKAERLAHFQHEQAELARLRAEAEAEQGKLWAEVKKTFANMDELAIRDYGRRLATMDAGRWMRDVGQRLIQERAAERTQAERARIEAQVRNRTQ